jgi:hypothetical protein
MKSPGMWALVHFVLAVSALATACGEQPPARANDGADAILVRYRVTFLGRIEMPAAIRFETPTGTRDINVAQLPWQSEWMRFNPHADVGVVVRIPMTDPTGNLQCEVLTDEPGTTLRSVSTRTCRASGKLPFARPERS